MRLIRSSICVFMSAALFCQPLAAYAVDPQELPTGGQITAGSGSISQNGANMTVNQTTNKMVANWNTFNIGSQASVNFVQPSSGSVALNRVLSADPSYIYGNLHANGQVFLLNPSGVIFGPGSSVNVGGLVASSLSLSNSNFLSGNYHFTNGAGAGNILNQGNIMGGVVALIAPQVSNQGNILTPHGTTALAAGDDVSLDFVGDGLLNVNVNTADLNALAENKNLIEADGGKVIMTALAAGDLMATVVNNSGIIQARGLSTQNGQIVLDGGSQGITRAAGTLDVSNAQGNGGSIVVTGDKVLVDRGASLNATGLTGGGVINVGGSWEAQDSNIRNANATIVDPTATLNASATGNGNGGSVVVRSSLDNANGATWAEGTLLANGGPLGGDGGRIETSGRWLDTSLVMASAASLSGLGNPGVWLFDPYNVEILSSDVDGSFSGAGTATWTPTASDSQINVSDITTDLNAGTNVTISTYDGGGGGDIGDLTDNATIAANSNFNTTLTLQAADTIVINDPISNSGSGKLNVTIDADNDNGAGNGVGIIFLNGNISTNGGDLNLGTGRTATVNGVSTLVGGDTYVGGTGASAITLSTNGGAFNEEGQMIVADTNGLTINTNGGNARFYSLLDSGDTYAYTANAAIDWTAALATAKTGTGANVGDTYLATVTSRLENAVAAYTADYNPSWLGGQRVTTVGTDNEWRWVAGPEGLQDGGKGLAFFTQNGSDAANGSGGTAIGSAYTNWNGGEPNNFGGANLSTAGTDESALQFVGNQGLWNDLPKTGTDVSGYVTETNLANSPVTVNAGTGSVTFSGAVGTNKALGSLTVTGSSGIAINGGAVTTSGLQTYNNPVTVGAASTTLTQTTADEDFTLQSNKTITNAFGANAALDIITTRDILLNSGSSISSSTGSLGVTLNSDSDATGGGAIVMYSGSSISSNGGSITLSGGTNTSTGYAQGRNGVADISNGISILGASLTSGGGNITLRGQSAATGAADSAGTGTLAFGIEIGKSSSGSTANTIDSGSGDISMTGVSTSTDASSNNHGIEVGTGGATATIKSASSDSNAIVISGTASSSASGLNASGMTLYQTIETTNGGGIQLTGVGGTSGGVSVGIYNDGNIFSNSGAITETGTGGGSGTRTQDIYFDSGTPYIGYKAATDVTSSSSNITLNANTISIDSSARLQSSGSLTVQPRTASTTIGIAGGSGTLSLPASYFSTNFVDGFSQLNIGKSNAGAITLGGATTFNDNVALIDNDNINLNAALNASGQTVTLTAGNGDTVSGNGNITASNLLLNGSGATYTLNTAANNSVGTIASTGITALNFINNGALTVGIVGATNGVTASGNITLQASGSSSDLTLNKAVTTTSGTITLDAGHNFINNNASNTGIVPGSGRYLVYSTDPAATTEAMTSYNKHYAQSYTAGQTPSYASSGNWFLYSITPTITVNISPVSETILYGDTAPTYSPSLSGFIDGDTQSVLSGGVNIGGTTDASGNLIVGDHSVTYQGSNNLGYNIVTSPADTLTVSQTVNPSSIESPQQGINSTDNNANSAINGAKTASLQGASSLGEEPDLVTQPMTLTSGSSSEPINVSANGSSMTLSTNGTSTQAGQPSATGQSGISVFILTAGHIQPESDFNLVDTQSSITLTKNGQNPHGAPSMNGASQSGDFTLNMPDGSVVRLTISLTGAGVLMINIPAGMGQLDIQTMTLIGLQAAKEKLKTLLSNIKFVVIVK